MACGLLNFASCLPEAFFRYLEAGLNTPLQPLLTGVKGLLSANVNISLFSSLWAIIVYMLSMFYALLIIYSGFQFIISGYDSEKREDAKNWLRNIVIMVILIQASFFIYELIVQLASVMTSATLSLIGDRFFKLTLDNLSNIWLEMVYAGSYIVVLLFTCIILVIRYLVVAVGVVLFPIAIFCYFIPLLRPYGAFILNFLGTAIFINFLDAILLTGFSQLANTGLFQNAKILVMLSAFLFINSFTLLMIFLSVVLAGLNSYHKAKTIIKRAKP